jgi:hypothetical protein
VVGQVGVGELLAALGGHARLDQGQGVDPGRRRRRLGGLGTGGRVGVAADALRDCLAPGRPA